jgi:hypothetical protein
MENISKTVKKPRKATLLATKVDKSVPGSALMARLWEKMLKDDISPTTLAEEHLDMAYSYLMMLGRGTAAIDQLKVKQYLKMAEYLGIPLMQVMLLAEAIKPEDFFYNADLEERVGLVYQKLCKDPVFMGFAPSEHEWNSLSLNLKLSFCVIYENSCQTKLLNVADLIKVEEPV